MGCQWQLHVRGLLYLYYSPKTLLWSTCKYFDQPKSILPPDSFFSPNKSFIKDWPLDYVIHDKVSIKISFFGVFFHKSTTVHLIMGHTHTRTQREGGQRILPLQLTQQVKSYTSFLKRRVHLFEEKKVKTLLPC